MDKTFNISIQSDSDGFIALHCKLCSRKFKMTVPDIEDETRNGTFCPACGMNQNMSEYYPESVAEAAMTVAAEMAENEIMNIFKKTFSGSKHIKVKTPQPKSISQPKVYTEEGSYSSYGLACCQREIKIEAASSGNVVYCPFCGLS
ncbi:MAG: hypothetical protein IT289_12510 [Oligoflexia bacterium]|nr:hypothetical protein [Oligoflexia bacterium]